MAGTTREDPVFDAIEFAARAHRGQYRKGTRIPYLVHPMAVARTLIELGLDEQVVVAGLLHDTTEDTQVTLAQVEEHFGARVARLVDAVSEEDKSKSWEQRKQDTLEDIVNLDQDVLLLECADKYDNICSISADLSKEGDSLWSRFNRSQQKQSWYYTSLAKGFSERAASLSLDKGTRLIESFCRKVKEVFGG